MKLNRYSIFFIIYTVTLFLLTVYSYSQIDLNLTLSSNSLYQIFQKQLIHLGYFNRPLSTSIYLFILYSLFTIYYLLLQLIKQKKVTSKNILWLIAGSTAILFLSYPAFSHDFFNYMFDARIVTRYHANPYLHSALDFPLDLWTRFMHWTHRTYPYGPVWLLITLLPSFLGFGKFVATLFLFKFMFTLFHLGNIFLIKKILDKISPKKVLLGVAFYALNPLILIESIVSPHNETPMLFFLLLSVYLLFNKRRSILSMVSLLLSVGTKFITVVLLPLFLFPSVIPDLIRDPFRVNFQGEPIGILKQTQNDKSKSKFSSIHPWGALWSPQGWLNGLPWGVFLKISLFLLLIPLIYQIIIREPYPWYFIPFIGIGALLPKNRNLAIFVSGISAGALLRYIPYLYKGEYTPSVSVMQHLLFVVPILFLLAWSTFKATRRKISGIMG